jgi:hypothetical protein
VWDPENPKPKLGAIQIEKPRPVVNIEPPQVTFDWYMEAGEIVRKRYGIDHKCGKYFIKDRPLIDNLDPELKGLLREWVRKMKRDGKWLDSPPNTPLTPVEQ